MVQVTRIHITPLVQDATGLAARHGELIAVPFNGSFDQARAWEIEPYTSPVVELEPPAEGTAYQFVLTIGAVITARIVTFHGADVNWNDLIDVDPDTLEPDPAGPKLAIWDQVKDDLLEAVQQARIDLDGYLEAHIMDPNPHAAYDDMTDLTLLFENRIVSGATDETYIPDLTTVFDTTI